MNSKQYHCFTLDHAEDAARRCFTMRYGYPPAEVIRDTLLRLGPVYQMTARPAEALREGDSFLVAGVSYAASAVELVGGGVTILTTEGDIVDLAEGELVSIAEGGEELK